LRNDIIWGDEMAYRGTCALAGALAFVAAALGTGALHAESALFDAEMPAPDREASFLESLAVGRIAGQDGDRLAFALERALGAPGVDGEPAFAIISAGGFGGVADAEGLVSGQVTTGVEEGRVERTRERCIERDEKDKCIKLGNVKERCHGRVITLSADVRIVRAADRRVVYSASKPRRDEVTWCRGDSSPRAAEPVIADMIDSIAADVRGDITPHIEHFHIRFREGRDHMPKEIGRRFKDAVEISMKDRAAACSAWRAIDTEMPGHPSVTFNLGLCAEAAGDYATAMQRYEQTQRIDDDGDVRDGLERVPLLIAARADAEQRDRLRR
jgi:hypothetical protein